MDFEYTHIVHKVFFFFVNQKLENVLEVLSLYRTDTFKKGNTELENKNSVETDNNKSS
jgi:hypothetical protein